MPPGDDPAIARAVAGVSRLTVESHPRLVGDRTWRFRDRLAPSLEVAMGLETAHPDALARLNKGCTLDDFAAAARALAAHGVGLRVFLLVHPPFVPHDERTPWLLRSIDAAIDAGASVIALIPTRGADRAGAMEALAAEGLFAPPSLATLEDAAAQAIRHAAGRARVLADLWDLAAFATCPACLDARRARLLRLNLEQRVPDPDRVRRLRRVRRRVAGLTAMARHTIDADVAIIGSGFAGALTALILRRQGRSVALLERGRHPRFAIGESTTPITNLVLEELADRWDLPRIRAFSKWGTWRATYPDVACGLKRGFTFFRHDLDRRFDDTAAHARQLLVAASPNDAIADTHWYRPDFDHWLVREAEREGVRYVDELALSQVRFEGPGVVLEGERRDEAVDVRAGFLIDASGPRGFLAKALGLAETSMRWLPGTQGLYGHFAGVERWDALNAADGDAAVSDRRRRGAPRLPGRLDLDPALRQRRDQRGRRRHRSPRRGAAVERGRPGVDAAAEPAAVGARPVRAGGADLPARPRAAPRLPRQAGRRPELGAPPVRGRRHRSAAVDRLRAHAPWHSTTYGRDGGPRPGRRRASARPRPGLLPASTRASARASARPLPGLGPGSARALPGLVDYERQTQAELDATEQLVAALYASMADFEVFKRLTLLYFAAASYTEAVRRLGHPERAPGFLLHADPPVRAGAAALRRVGPHDARRVRGSPRRARSASSRTSIGPSSRSTPPACAIAAGATGIRCSPSDLVAGAPKLGATAREIGLLLARSGFAGEAPDAGGSGQPA